MAQRVVVVGDALIDELRGEGGSREFVGGAALNVAVGLAVLGHRPTLLAMVGDDEDGSTIRRFLDDHGVELLATRAPNGPSPAGSDPTAGRPPPRFHTPAPHPPPR